jgi:hypothetical protein
MLTTVALHADTPVADAILLHALTAPRAEYAIVYALFATQTMLTVRAAIVHAMGGIMLTGTTGV